MTTPIKPEDVGRRHAITIPNEVIEVFNDEIERAWDGTKAVVHQQDLIDRIGSKMTITGASIIERRWLDVESVYRAAGWTVEYDKPGYNETYDPQFTFRKTTP